MLTRWDGWPVNELRRAWRVPALKAVEACASTSDLARTAALGGAPHGATVVADHQSAGRGRQGRTWSDRPEASLLLSMVLRPAASAHPGAAGADPGATAALPLLVGLACARAIRSCTGLQVGVEWPNDLVIGDAKLGGILCESARSGARIVFVVVGIGINVAALPGDLDHAGRVRATSITDALGAEVDRPLRSTLGGEIARRLVRMHADSPLAGADLEELRRLDSLAGRQVRFGTDRTGREGVACGILPDGALLVEAGGERIEVRAGSVSPVASLSGR